MRDTQVDGLDRLVESLERRICRLEDGIRSEVLFISEANGSGWNDPDEIITNCCEDLANLADNKPPVKRY